MNQLKLSPELEKIRASRDELGEVASCLARAFHQDPLPVMVVSDPELRARVLPAVLGFCLRYTYEFGHVFKFHDRSGKVCGGAGFVEGEHHDMHADHALATRLGADEIARIAGEEVSRQFDDFMNEAADFRKQCMEKANRQRGFGYFSTVGVEPSAMARSTMAAVVGHDMKLCFHRDNDWDAWGETWNPIAYRFYTKKMKVTTVGETTVMGIPVMTFYSDNTNWELRS